MTSAIAWTVGELARKAGVTVRTLHHYDQMGLLSPSDYTEAGYRLYGQQALMQLQQILTLKALGLPLEDIHRILVDPGFELGHCLRQQKQALQARLKELTQAVETIEAVEAQLAAKQAPEPDLLFKIMEVIQMKQSQEWVSQFYSPEQLEALKQRQQANPDEAQQGAQAWADLFAEIRSQMHQDPGSEEVQRLLPDWQQRWQELIKGFTQGNAELSSSLNNLYANIDKAPAQVKQGYDEWTDVRDFMEKAKKAGKQS